MTEKVLWLYLQCLRVVPERLQLLTMTVAAGICVLIDADAAEAVYLLRSQRGKLLICFLRCRLSGLAGRRFALCLWRYHTTKGENVKCEKVTPCDDTHRDIQFAVSTEIDLPEKMFVPGDLRAPG